MSSTVKSIETEQEYELTLKELEKMLHAKPHTSEGDYLLALSQLVHEYEMEHWKIEPLINQVS